MYRTQRFGRAFVAAALVGAVLLAGSGAIDARVTPDTHPSFIYRGTCAGLGDVAYPLTPILSSEFASPESEAGAATANRTSSSVTTLDVSLTELLASPHAIAVRQITPGATQNVICGDVGGIVTRGELAIGLGEVQGSGDVGLAILESAGSRTTVTVYLVHALVAISSMPTDRISAVEVNLTNTRITATQTTFQVGSTHAFAVSNLSSIENELVIARTGEGDRPLASGGGQAAVYSIPPGQSKTLTWTFTEAGTHVLTSRLPAPFEIRAFLVIEVRPQGSPGSQPERVPPPEPVIGGPRHA